MDTEDTGLSIAEIAQFVWKRRWVVILPVVLAVVGALLYTSSLTPRYRAEAILQVDAAAIRPQAMDPFSGLSLSREAVPTFIELMKTRPILSQVAYNLGLPEGASLGRITLSEISRTAFLRITVENTDARLAADVANELADVIRAESLLEWHRRADTAAAILQVSIDSLLQQIERTRDALAAGEGNPRSLGLQLSSFESQYAIGLSELEAMRLGTARITDVLTLREPAVASTRAVYPHPIRNVFTALLLGAVIGLALAFGLEYLDANKVRSPEQLRRLLGAPVMGALPIHRLLEPAEGPADVIRRVEDPSLLEPYHLLRANLQFSRPGAESQTILVTSAEMGEGKTTVVANLALAHAMAGQKVIALDADMRRPGLHRALGVGQHEGLNEYLSGNYARVAEFLSDCPLPVGARSGSLKVLVAGASTATPMAILGSERMRLMLDQLKKMADVIILDSPPVLYSSDALVVANAVDRVILVVWSGMLRNAAIQRARDALDMVKATRVDVVLNKLRRDVDTYAYYSRYYHEEHQQPQKADEEEELPRAA